ncbi:MAG: orotidine-5'-phosphate decarboxylase [Actinomycetes bacterium]|jgi:orotidine-5'-phosphate decarboxylase|nr:orotidine-5'-phosphate decarboxylase [Actinomycetes bacterium]
MTAGRDKIIVALDGDADEVLAWAQLLAGTVSWVKVGMTNYYRQGPELVRTLKDWGYHVFLDLKLHDIPYQVEGAAASLSTLGVEMFTVHAFGGREMMAAAVRGAHSAADAASLSSPKVIAVTVLTSLSDAALATVGVGRDAQSQVMLLTRLATDACVDGIVCSPLEAGPARSTLGAGAAIITPGVRPLGSARADQSRVSTPAKALAAGASQVVIGRPITGAASPVDAFEAILAEIERDGESE